MADCGVRRESKVPARYIDQVSSNFASKKRKPSKRDNNLYDVIVTEVDKTKKRMKIHYVGYSTEYDEWRPFGEGASFPFIRFEKLNKPSAVSFDDRTELFHGQLYREIKKKLYSGGKDDPAVRIQLKVEINRKYKIVYVVRKPRQIISFWPLVSSRKSLCAFTLTT